MRARHMHHAGSPPIESRLSVLRRMLLALGRRSRRSHHRRRRWLAVGSVTLAIAALTGGLLAGASGSAHRGGALRPHPRLPDRPRLTATGEQAAENAAIDRTLAFSPYVRVAGGQHREIALTFDDGPGPYTPEIIRILSREHVPATFFEVGVEERYFHASTTAIASRGWVIGDHTQTHPLMSVLSARDQRTELLGQTASTGSYGAPFPRLFRPPYGRWNDTTLRLLRRYRMLMVLWTVDTDDYLRPGVAAIVRAAVSRAQPGAIILLHDAGGNRSQTVAALPRIVRALRARGYELVTVPKLLLDNPPPRDQRVTAAMLGAAG